MSENLSKKERNGMHPIFRGKLFAHPFCLPPCSKFSFQFGFLSILSFINWVCFYVKKFLFLLNLNLFLKYIEVFVMQSK